MRFLLLVVALLLAQSSYAADSVKANRAKKVKSDTVKVVKADKAKKSKGGDTVKVVTPPAPLKPLFIDIIPQPLSLVKGEGRFTINEQTALVYDKGLADAADYLGEYLHLTRNRAKKGNSIRLSLDKKLGKEAYRLVINEKGIELRGGDYGGVFNGVQSLLQLLPYAIYTKNAALPMEVAYVDINDAPQYHYRGFLLDVARTFQPVHEVKRVIDYMAYCKLNKLHFHLTDDEGWRVEIKKHPYLAIEGGFRGGDSKIMAALGRYGQKYGGYYTHDELRDIVAYAKRRNIEVIPEIDMPGHSRALGRVHPAIYCNYTPDTSGTRGVDMRAVWCAAKEENYALVEDIVKELVEIFTSEYIHIGGDEVSFSQWKLCPDCTKLMKEKGLADYKQLEQYFVNRVSDILTKYNRKTMVWDEAVEGGLLPKTTMVSGWRSVKRCLSATAQGYNTIVMPHRFFYLNMRQSADDRGHQSKGLSLENICGFTLENAGFTQEQSKYVAGIEAAFWSEIYLENITPRKHFSDYIEYMLFPRLFGVAEIAWSKQRRSYEDMYALLKSNFYHKLHGMSASFRLEKPTVKIENGKIYASTNDGSKIYYTDIRNNKTQEYKTLLNAELAPFVTFQSRMLTGYSCSTTTPEFNESHKPKVKITSSLPFGKRYPVENCERYEKWSTTSKYVNEGDWFEYRFEDPVRATYINIATGLLDMSRRLIYKGSVEVSYDGESFVKAGNLRDGAYVLLPKKKPIYAIRIVSQCEGETVAIRPLIIK